MICPNCKFNQAKSIITINEEGGKMSIRCEVCFPKTKGKRGARAEMQSEGANVMREDDPKFAKYALPEAVVAETQRLKPSIPTRKATPQQRDRDDVDKILDRKRVRLFEMADSRMAFRRNERVLNKAKSILGTDNVRVVSDNGFEVIVEVAA